MSPKAFPPRLGSDGPVALGEVRVAWWRAPPAAARGPQGHRVRGALNAPSKWSR